MSKCKYCGLSAGLFSHAHKECEEKHKQGVAELLAYIHSYFCSTDIIGTVSYTHLTLPTNSLV